MQQEMPLFPSQLRELVQHRDAISRDESLPQSERESRVASLTLPGQEENLPGVRLEDLW